MFEIDATRVDLAREFKNRPYGEHSPDLQYVLNVMRRASDQEFHVLVMTRPHAQWTLARMKPGAPTAPAMTNVVFSSPEEAEWHVFRLRWKALTGQECPVE
jgi:hypothetical protein